MILPHNPCLGNLTDEMKARYKAKFPKAIGYWRLKKGEWKWQRFSTELPWPEDYIDESWPVEERKLIADYLNAGEVKFRWLGSSDCRLCGKYNGSVCLGDGEYDWPEGFGHYVLDHCVKPPIAFIEYVKGK